MNATILIVNFKDIVNRTNVAFISLGSKFSFQENDTMTMGGGAWPFGYWSYYSEAMSFSTRCYFFDPSDP